MLIIIFGVGIDNNFATTLKKLFVILVMLVYGYSATGMTLHLHYCCGKLKTIEWSPSASKDCGEDHSMGSRPCCETKMVSGNQNPDQESSVLLSNKIIFEKCPVMVHPEPLRIHVFSIPIPDQKFSHSPPPENIPLFKQQRVFRI